MKIVTSSDWHHDASTAGFRRAEDVARAAQAVVDAAIEEKVDYFFFLGDLTDPDVGAFAANEMAIRRALMLAEHGIESYWLVGNHDVVEDGLGTHAMLPLSAVAKVFAEPEVMSPEPGLRIICLPYTSTARSYDPEKEIRAAHAMIPDGSKVIVLSHLMLEGISAGSETNDMPRGRDVFLPYQLIFELWPHALVLSGHYHEQQNFHGVNIPGSLVRLTRGEVDNKPGYLVIEL